MTPPVGIARSTAWFAAASMVTTILHELTHAALAYTLGVRATLFNYSVGLDLTPAQAATTTRALIGIAGPVFGLGLGIVAWSAEGRGRYRPALHLSRLEGRARPERHGAWRALQRAARPARPGQRRLAETAAAVSVVVLASLLTRHSHAARSGEPTYNDPAT